jgi:hypothetical protein
VTSIKNNKLMKEDSIELQSDGHTGMELDRTKLQNLLHAQLAQFLQLANTALGNLLMFATSYLRQVGFL